MLVPETEEFLSLQSLEHVLDWSRRHGLDLNQLDVVTQDEFSHEVLVPFGPNGDLIRRRDGGRRLALQTDA
jgi:hypothetical protein